eukprot:364061-Chlamydomonas_euryale.AAC.3
MRQPPSRTRAGSPILRDRKNCPLHGVLARARRQLVRLAAAPVATPLVVAADRRALAACTPRAHELLRLLRVGPRRLALHGGRPAVLSGAARRAVAVARRLGVCETGRDG